MPKVTVITPNFNHARYLPRRIDSILNQTFQDLELIILDDASTDNSREVIESYANDPRVKTIFNAVNSGSTFKQWDLGLRHARGEYVWFAESDDYADPSFLETLVDRLDRHPNVGLAYCQSWVIDADDNLLSNYLETLERENHTTRWRADYVNSGHDECPNYLFWHNTIPNASAVLLRRRILERAGGPAEDMLLYGDACTYINVLSISDIAFVSSPLNYFRQHQNNVRSRVLGRESAHESLRAQWAVIKHYGLPKQLRDDHQALAAYVSTWIGVRRQPPYQKVPPWQIPMLLSRFARMHPKALRIGLSILAWEQMADLARRVGLLDAARALKNALTKTTQSNLRLKGFRSLARRASVKIARQFGCDISYQAWIWSHSPTRSDRAAQRRWARITPSLPHMTMMIRPTDHSSKNLLRTLRSLKRQTYPHWSTILLENDTHVPNQGSSPGEGGSDYVGIMSAGDTLSPNALYEFARAIVDRDPPPDVLYCDEDRLARDGRTRFRPIFKPSWSPEMLLSYDYTGRLTLARRTLVDAVGGFDFSLDEVAEWDMMLRLSEQTDHIVRIPRCLYHNAGNPGTSRTDGGSKPRLVLESHLARIGLEGAQAVQQPNGTFRVTWPLPHQPLVSVIIPTRNRPDLIKRCVEGIIHKTDYPAMEIILVDNGSTDPDTLSFYDQWVSSGVLSIVPFNQPFNYSTACNLGAAAAHGEFLLFLNNDIEVIHPDWLEELVRWGQLRGIGFTGAKLIYPNGMIQHAGRFIPIDMASLFAGGPDDVENSPTGAIFGTPNVYRNVTSLLGACQLVKRTLFDEIGGFDERSLMCSSDDIICLEAQRRGFRILYTPYAGLIHHESITRGRDDQGPGEDRVLLAQVLDRLDYQEDPFFHPELDPRWLTPTLRPEWVPASRERLRQRIEGLTVLLPKGDTSLHFTRPSLEDFLNGLVHHPIGVHWSAERVGQDIEAASWFVIDILRQDGELVRQYPRALSDGVDGDFCGWLCSAGMSRYGLHSEACVTIRAAFASSPGDSVRRLIEDLGAESGNFRVARIPSLLTGLLSWLVEHKQEYGISDRHIWWFLLESLEDPIRELLRVYDTNPDWQKFFPDAFSPSGWKRLTHWIRDRYGFDATAYDVPWHTPSSPIEQRKCDGTPASPVTPREGAAEEAKYDGGDQLPEFYCDTQEGCSQRFH